MMAINRLTHSNIFRVFLLSIAALVSIMLLSVTAFAGSEGKTYVTDDAGILSESEEKKLEELCKKTSDGCKTDVAIVTLKTGLDNGILDDYIRANYINARYGYNEDSQTRDAIVYVIDMVSRADRVITSGNARSDISQASLDNLRINAEDKLKEGDYFDGCKAFVNGVMKRMNNSLGYKLTTYLPVKIGISFVVALIGVLILMYNAKAHMTVDGNTYSKEHGHQILAHHDRFIRTTVVTHTIQDNDSSRGGGGGGGNSGSSGGHF